jgi:hypothetical protein
MSDFNTLLSLAGEWEGRNRVQPDPKSEVNESSSHLKITPILRDTFLRIDQTWRWKDDPQFGSMLIGFSPRTGEASMHWIDTWHNGRGAMQLKGRFDERGRLTLHGHFSVENSADWGWRIEIFMRDGRLIIDMFCVNPNGGKDEGWVWGDFGRV